MFHLHRPPSVAWEPILLPGDLSAWAWFYPPTAPLTIQFQIPPVHLSGGASAPSPRTLLQALALPVEAVEGWDIGGVQYDLEAGALPQLGQPFTVPPETPLHVSLRLRPSAVAAAFAAPPLAAPYLTPGGPGPTQGQPASFDALEADWLAIQQVERQLEAARKQLAALQGRLQSLNRDLNPEERLHADNQDRKDWTDARRWLRDAAAQVSRYIREYDIGSVSGAGGRNRFEDVYREYVQPRRPFPGLAAAQLEFEQYRKTHQALLLQMQSVLSNAQRDGEQRAQQLLSRIAAKVRIARTKR